MIRLDTNVPTLTTSGFRDAGASLEPIFTAPHAITTDICGSMYVLYASGDHLSAGRPD